MKKRRRYDTVELVMELKRERRNALLLTFIGVTILAVLLIVYFTASSDEQVASVPPAGPTQPQPQGEPPRTTVTVPTAVAAVAEAQPATLAPEPPQESPKPAVVQVGAARKPQLWIDGKPVKPKQAVELEPGEHKVKAKLGKKTVTQSITVEAGESYDLRLDARRKKVQLKKK